MKKIINYFKEAYDELKKVVWPSKEVILRHTIVVILTVFVVMMILIAVDFGLSTLIKYLITLRK